MFDRTKVMGTYGRAFYPNPLILKYTTNFQKRVLGRKIAEYFGAECVADGYALLICAGQAL